MEERKVLVVGGTGYFGRLLVDDLLCHAECDLVVASRRPFRSHRFETVVADLWDPASMERAISGVKIAICAAGPFQKLPTSFAEMCIERRIHYIDIADDRRFVQRVRGLLDRNRYNAAVVCPGWSTVSALSGVLTQIASHDMRAIDSIRIQMAAGNRGARQQATIASLMHSVGQPFKVLHDGIWHHVTGWSEPHDFTFPLPVGRRRGYLVDVPDHELFPELFHARTLEFRAGAELGVLNECLWLLGRTKWNCVKWSALFQRAGALLSWIGHDWGAIGVEVHSTSSRRVCIVADSSGARIAVLPASVMTTSLLAGESHHGLVSPATWLTGKQLRTECQKRGFRLIMEEF